MGASGFSLDENKVIHFSAKTVVLCTGSGGFKPSGFPVCDLTHDGSIMAYDIGAKITGKEWNDGHPGSAKNSGSSYDNWHGQIEEKPSTTTIRINHHLGVDLNYRPTCRAVRYRWGRRDREQGLTTNPLSYQVDRMCLRHFAKPAGRHRHGHNRNRACFPCSDKTNTTGLRGWEASRSVDRQRVWPSTNPRDWCRSTIPA